ncbi:alpha/beta hydrolase [Bacillus sp. JJ1533]|uniref:alpha/beta hydrolase n=1 Tax=Bacillus sp. JJ1533 TaxID=3122959 RepID=UPI003000AE71
MEKLQTKLQEMSTDTIIKKTILASMMDNGFWSRWYVHGIDEDFVKAHKSKMITAKGWVTELSNKAQEYKEKADTFKSSNDFAKAEENYRKAGIYLNLAQWVYPEPHGIRADWYKKCLDLFDLADEVSAGEVFRHTLTINGKNYGGRIHLPESEPQGVVILVTPTDSTKEEFYLYEQDFVNEGLVVISFDGTGQGETLMVHGHKADYQSWKEFTKGVVEFAHLKFPNLSINLFGTSSGGAWAIEASRHPLVDKIVSVSPPTRYASNIRLPDYFRNRMSNMLVDFDTGYLPTFEEDSVSDISNIVIVHGEKDLLIDGKELKRVYNNFDEEKRFIIYENEAHCCDNKLGEIRHRSAEWFKGVNINDI